jgi:hypothetical protein
MLAEQTLVLVGLGVTTSATWIVWRHAGWAWVLQDLMGLALVLNIIATLRVPTLKVHPSWSHPELALHYYVVCYS